MNNPRFFLSTVFFKNLTIFCSIVYSLWLFTYQLSNVEPVQYLDGWPLGCAMDNGSESEIGE